MWITIGVTYSKIRSQKNALFTVVRGSESQTVGQGNPDALGT